MSDGWKETVDWKDKELDERVRDPAYLKSLTWDHRGTDTDDRIIRALVRRVKEMESVEGEEHEREQD